MDTDYTDRMASPRKRGRPSLAEVAARSKPEPATPVEVTAANLPPMIGFHCKHCGRGMVPRITHTNERTRYCVCSLCGRRMRVDYSEDGVAQTIQKL